MEEKSVQRPVELSEEQLEKTSGGGFMMDIAVGFKTCPHCGLEMPYDGSPGDSTCPNCGQDFSN